MKNVTISCRQILRAIRAAYIALFLAACAGSASAAPSFGSGFTATGTTVTGSGSYSGTYFYDGSTIGYTVTVQPGAQLDNSGSGFDNLIQFDHGSVNNSGSLYGNDNSSSDAIYIGTTTGGGTATDSITNTSSGYIYGSNSGVYVYNNVSGGASVSSNIGMTNSGDIRTTSDSGNYAVGLFSYNDGTTGDISNTTTLNNTSNATISGYYAGVEIANYTNNVTGNVTSQITVTNSGYIYGNNEDGSGFSYSGVYLYNDIDSSTTGNVVSGLALNNSGTINGANYSVSGYNLARDVSGNATNTIAITNSGSLFGGNDAGISVYNESNGVGGDSKNTISLTNSGAIYTYGTDGVGASLSNSAYSVDGNISNSITVGNTSTGNISGSAYGLYTSNIAESNGTTGTITNTISVTNAGEITDGGPNANSGIYASNSGKYNYYATKETNAITLQNTGSVSGYNGIFAVNNANQEGWYAFGTTLTNTIGINNSGYVEGYSGYGIYAANSASYTSYEESLATVKNSISIVNSGAEGYIYADSNYGIYANNENYENRGTSTNSISITNSSTYLSNSGYQIYANDDDAIHALNETSENYGDVKNTISVMNSGSVYGDGTGIYAENHNTYTFDGGNITNTISISNTGVGNDNSDYGIFAYSDGIHAYNHNYDTSGTVTNKITVMNSGSLYAWDNGIYAENGSASNGGDVTSSIGIMNTGSLSARYDRGISAYNHTYNTEGNVSNTIAIANTGSVTQLIQDDGIYAQNHNYEVGGTVANSIAISNSGSVSAYSNAVNALSYSNYTYGPSATNTFSLVNTGSLYAKHNQGVFAENHNRHSYGSASNTASLYNGSASSIYSWDNNAVQIYNHNSNTYGGDATNSITVANVGAITGRGGDGLYLRNHNYNTGGNSVNTIDVANAGSIVANDGDGLDLSNGDYATNGTSTATVNVVNTASGYIFGANTGIYIQNSAYNGTPTTTVVNAGSIAGGSYGVYLDSDNASLLSYGGSIYGGNEAVFLNGSNSNVTIQGRTNVHGEMDGNVGGQGNSTNNFFNANLVGMTPAEAAAANAQNGNSSGDFTAGGYTYQWQNFTGSTIKAVSLELVVDSGLTEVATKIDNNPLPLSFDAFYAAASANPEAATNSLVGREFDEAFATIEINQATNIGDLFSSRAADLRLGTNGLDTAGLNIVSGSMIASLGATENTLSRMLGTSSLLGGTTMSDSKEALTCNCCDENRWGAWASGTVTIADESSTATAPGFNYSSGSPTIGADYRFDRNFVFGGLLNFTDTGADFGDGSRLNIQSGLLGAYGVYSNGPWYINGLGGVGYDSYHNQRISLGGANAISDPDGYQVVADLTGGYDFKLGDGWTVSPEGGVLYTHLMEGSYSERNAGAFDLAVSQQDVDSLRSKLGFRIVKDFTWDHIKFSQQVRGAWYHECLDDSRGVQTALPGAGGLGSFNVKTNQAERDFAILGAGLNATPDEWHGNVTFFVNYDAQVGQSDYIAHNINGGFRVGF